MQARTGGSPWWERRKLRDAAGERIGHFGDSAGFRCCALPFQGGRRRHGRLSNQEIRRWPVTNLARGRECDSLVERRRFFFPGWPELGSWRADFERTGRLLGRLKTKSRKAAGGGGCRLGGVLGYASWNCIEECRRCGGADDVRPFIRSMEHVATSPFA